MVPKPDEIKHSSLVFSYADSNDILLALIRQFYLKLILDQHSQVLFVSVYRVEEVGAGEDDGVGIGQKDVGGFLHLEELVVFLEAGVCGIDVTDFQHVTELADHKEFVALDDLHAG